MNDGFFDKLANRLRDLSQQYDVTLPRVGTEFLVCDLSNPEQARMLVERFNICVRNGGDRNFLLIHPLAGRKASATEVQTRGSENIAVIGAESGLSGSLNFIGNGNLAVLSGGQNVFGLEAHMDDRGILLCGEGATSWGVRIWAFGRTACVIGDDSLLDENINIRTTDHHSVIDLKTWKQINFPADVVIGRHVWVGPSTQISKGVRIGTGSVVNAGSILVKSVGRCECWGGAPAKLIRGNASWVRSHPATQADLTQLRTMLEAGASTRSSRWLAALRGKWPLRIFGRA